MSNSIKAIFFLLCLICNACLGQNVSELKVRFSSGWSIRAMDNGAVVLIFGSSVAHMAQIKDDSITPIKILNYLSPDLDEELETPPKGAIGYVACYSQINDKWSYYNFNQFDQLKPFIDYLSSKATFFNKGYFGEAINQVPFFSEWRPSPSRAGLFNRKLFDDGASVSSGKTLMSNSITQPTASSVTARPSMPMPKAQASSTPTSQPVQRLSPSPSAWPLAVGLLLLAVFGGVWWKFLRK